MTKFIVANDVGTTRVKSLAVYSTRPGQPHKFEVESVLGETRELLGDDNDLMKIATNEGEWFIGPSAVRYSRNLIRGRDKRWPFSPQYRALHLFSVAQHVSPSSDKVDVDLVSGLPFSDRANAEQIKDSLRGEHSVEVGGKRLRVEIKGVYFAIQGVAAIMAEGFRNGDTIAWLGLGGRNKTYATIAAGKILPDRTGSREGGMLSALDDFITKVRNETDLDLTEPEAIDAISSRFVTVGRERVDITKFVKEAITPYRDSISDLIGSVWPVDIMPRVNDFRIGGGGALGIGEQLAQNYRQARVVPDPRWTEAQGLLNLGISRFG